MPSQWNTYRFADGIRRLVLHLNIRIGAQRANDAIAHGHGSQSRLSRTRHHCLLLFEVPWMRNDCPRRPTRIRPEADSSSRYEPTRYAPPRCSSKAHTVKGGLESRMKDTQLSAKDVVATIVSVTIEPALCCEESLAIGFGADTSNVVDSVCFSARIV